MEAATTLVAGEGHTLLLTAGGELYAWGNGMFGRLGTGWDENESLPIRIRFSNGSGEQIQASLVSIAAGAYHSIAVTADGVVWAWGYNAYHQLGREDAPACNVPCAVEFPSEKKPQITSVKAGGMTSCALEADGTLWMWGLCPGAGMQPKSSPERVSALLGKQVQSVACGTEHVLVIAASKLYAWGKNSRGQLGLGDTEPRGVPTWVQVAKDGCAKSVSAGAYHSAVVVEQDGINACWTFGLGENGQLGHGTTVGILLPKRVESLEGEGVLAVACGLFHTCCVTSTGTVLVWGMELGFGLFPLSGTPGMDTGDALLPSKMLKTDASQFRGVTCGASHTVMLVDGGCKLLAWGRGRHGVLGTGNDEDSLIPVMVSWPPTVECKAAEGAAISVDHASNISDSEDHAATGETVGNNELLKVISNLQEELSAARQRASVLESAFYGADDTFIREWERQVETASFYDLSKYEAFYKRMKSHVNETMLRRKVELWCKALMPESNRKDDSHEQQASYSVNELEALARRLNQMR